MKNINLAISKWIPATVVAVIIFCAGTLPSTVFAAISTDFSTYVAPATVNMTESSSAGYGIIVYDSLTSDAICGSNSVVGPITFDFGTWCNANSHAGYTWDPNTPATFSAIEMYAAGCIGVYTTYAACLAVNPSASVLSFTITAPPPTSTDVPVSDGGLADFSPWPLFDNVPCSVSTNRYLVFYQSTTLRGSQVQVTCTGYPNHTYNDLLSYASSSAPVLDLEALLGSTYGDGVYTVGINGASDSYPSYSGGTYAVFTRSSGHWTSSGGSYTPSTGTRIIAVTPAAKSTVGTSTAASFGVIGYITPDDFAQNPTVTLELSNTATKLSQSAFLLAPIAASSPSSASSSIPIHRKYTFTPSAAGAFAFSTTTDLSIVGVYDVAAKIQANPTLLQSFENLFFAADNVMATYASYFTVVKIVAIDAFRTDLTNSTSTKIINDAVNDAINGCTSFVATPVACIAWYSIPSQNEMNKAGLSVYNNLATRPPFGYITRFWNILSGTTAVTEPPPIAYTFGSSSPAALQGKSVSYQIWDYVGTTSPLFMARADDGTNKNIWDIVDPFWEMIVAFAVLMSILADVFGFAFDLGTEIGNKNIAAVRANNVKLTAVGEALHQRHVEKKRLYQDSTTAHPFGYGRVRYNKNLD